MNNNTKSAVQPKTSNEEVKKMARVVKNLQSASKKPLTTGSLVWLLLILSATIVAPSLVVINAKSCASGSLSIKLWEFEYILVKSGNCGALPEHLVP